MSDLRLNVLIKTSTKTKLSLLFYKNLFSYLHELLKSVDWKSSSSQKLKLTAKWILVSNFYLKLVPKRSYLVKADIFFVKLLSLWENLWWETAVYSHTHSIRINYQKWIF